MTQQDPLARPPYMPRRLRFWYGVRIVAALVVSLAVGVNLYKAAVLPTWLNDVAAVVLAVILLLINEKFSQDRSERFMEEVGLTDADQKELAQQAAAQHANSVVPSTESLQTGKRAILLILLISCVEGVLLLVPAAAMQEGGRFRELVFYLADWIPGLTLLHRGLVPPWPMEPYKDALILYFLVYWVCLPVQGFIFGRVVLPGFTAHDREMRALAMYGGRPTMRHLAWALFACFLAYVLLPYMVGDIARDDLPTGIITPDNMWSSLRGVLMALVGISRALTWIAFTVFTVALALPAAAVTEILVLRASLKGK
jgi:hypothetical protein